ncbi:hypothetical protein BRD20_10515 [Halobacteriales archaeon SW_8_65_20]|nr:MAG: hypothetical protein BRC71_09730 [Halobacteriales archaeon QH_7_65_31]PSQ31710.1 MAG: hypothetical protein BRD16_02025 [Halobacteriales archaeon SW_6_65_46]PSQ51673.1 MAG: hypothetical protein BRD20_10515 [Halobacteriales archaeon SW_8_65_20]
MTGTSEDESVDDNERILSYLRERAADGERYFRAKQVADAIGLTAKQVGARLPRLAERSEDVDIEKWGRARSTTWRVTPE